MIQDLEQSYRLRWMDFDRYGRIKPSAVLDLFQDVATLQAEHMGIGYDDMHAQGVFWAIVRMKYEIKKDPVHYETVKVRTWPHTPTRFSFLRDFSIRDAETDELLIGATSEWVLMDYKTRKFSRITDHYTQGDDEFDTLRNFDEKPRKVPAFEADEPVLVMMPSFVDIDQNGHVNNSRYADYALNALTPEADAQLRIFQIDFRHEVLPDSPLAMYTQESDKLVLAKGVREDGEMAFACSFELR